MKKNNKNLRGFSNLLVMLIVVLLVGVVVYFGLPQYTKYKAKQDIERVGITFSEQKFVEKACDGDEGSVALFIRAGMNINVLAVPPNNDRTAKSVLHCAAGLGNLTLVKSLLDLGADVNIKDDASSTPLFSASGPIRQNRRGDLANNLDVVKLLIERGADINAGGVAGTPIVAAVQSRSFEVFDYLLEKGADVKAKNKEGMTPLMLLAYAYNNKGKEMAGRVAALIKSGADINVTNQSGQTALMIAVNNRSKDMVRVLLENGADPSVEDKNGSNILTYAMSDPETLKMFLEKGADPNVSVSGQPILHQAATRSDAAFQILLASKKTDVNIKNSNGDSVLHILARAPQYAQKINLLLARSALVNATNNQLETPLIKAVQSRNLSAITVFLDSQANVNARDAAGRTALYYANQNAGRGVYNEYPYGSSAQMAVAAPAEMAPSSRDIREIMRTNDNAALQRYIAEMRTKNSPSAKYGRPQPTPTTSDPVVSMLIKRGATL